MGSGAASAGGSGSGAEAWAGGYTGASAKSCLSSVRASLTAPCPAAAPFSGVQAGPAPTPVGLGSILGQSRLGLGQGRPWTHCKCWVSFCNPLGHSFSRSQRKEDSPHGSPWIKKLEVGVPCVHPQLQR